MSRKKRPSQSKRSQFTQRRAQRKSREAKRSRRQTNKDTAKETLNWFFGLDDIFSHLVFHGNIKWRASDLSRMALLFSWSEKVCVTDAFPESVKRCKKLARIFHQRVLSLDFLGDCHRIAKNSAGSRFLTQRPLSPKLSHAWFRLSEGQPVSGISREESVWNNA